MNEYTHDENRYELAAFEDDLRRIIQITKRRIRQAHCSHSEEGYQYVCFDRNPGNINKYQVNKDARLN